MTTIDIINKDNQQIKKGLTCRRYLLTEIAPSTVNRWTNGTKATCRVPKAALGGHTGAQTLPQGNTTGNAHNKH